jgi:putative OPT family oligopeptide transporter
VFFMGTGAEFLGLGFIIGIRYASIICAGSFLSWFVIIPLLGPLGLEQLRLLNPDIASGSAEDIFTAIPRNIGIGGIFTAGLLSILKMGKVIITALRQALGGLFAAKGAGGVHDRTDEDISYPALLVIGIVITIGIFLYFRFVALANMPNPTSLTILSVVLALAIAFLFTTVSAWAIAMISVTPISGMTVTTIIITAVVMLWAGLPTETDADRAMSMLGVLLVGGVVCTALSMAGTLVTEFKIGYWLGASPKKICWSAIIASLLASAVVTLTIMVCAVEPGYIPAVNPEALRAPQANVMASALQSFIGGGGVPWLMYGTGAVIVLMVELVGVSGLAFALGMYLPMELNTPILVGAIVAMLVKKSAKDEKLSKARSDKGILIASGLIAGAAVIGVVKNGLTIFFKDFMEKTINIAKWMVDGGWEAETVARFSNWLGLFAFLALCVWSYWDSRRAKPDDETPPGAVGG